MGEEIKNVRRLRIDPDSCSYPDKVSDAVADDNQVGVEPSAGRFVDETAVASAAGGVASVGCRRRRCLRVHVCSRSSSRSIVVGFGRFGMRQPSYDELSAFDAVPLQDGRLPAAVEHGFGNGARSGRRFGTDTDTIAAAASAVAAAPGHAVPALGGDRLGGELVGRGGGRGGRGRQE